MPTQHSLPTEHTESVRAVILVEGVSDSQALTVLSRRRGRDLAGDGVVVVPMGGATNIGHFIERLGPHRPRRIAGMCDYAEARHVVRALEAAGLGNGLARTDLEACGFFLCVEDLEDELIRALGTDRVQEVLAEHGDLASFRRMQRQPAHRQRARELQLRRFLGSGSGRKLRYAGLLVEALDLAHVPEPLDKVLAYV